MLPKRIIFSFHLAAGDSVISTAGIRDFKKAYPDVDVQVNCTCQHIYDNNPYINRDKWTDIIDGQKNPKESIQKAIKEDRPVKIYIGTRIATNQSNTSDRHFIHAHRLSINDTLDLDVKQGAIRPDIHLSQEEFQAPRITEKPYWIITAGNKNWPLKIYPFSWYQQVVSELSDITFVQIGDSGHGHKILKGSNVINMVGKTQNAKTGIRDLFKLYNNCEGSIGLVSMQTHLAAAFGKPCITVAGAREPQRFTLYPGQCHLGSDGFLPCTLSATGEPKACWFCATDRCRELKTIDDEQIPLCVRMITPEILKDTILKYYEGGRLKLNKHSGRSNLVGITKPEIITTKKEKKIMTEIKPKTKSGFSVEFGGGALTERDWDFIQGKIKKHSIKSICEIGAGLSTMLYNTLDLDNITTFETHPGWIKKVKEESLKAEIYKWDGKIFPPMKREFDMFFVDGPAGGINREPSFILAAKYAQFIVVHDAGREWEKVWAEKHLTKDFDFKGCGGHRCHFWVRKSESSTEYTKKLIEINSEGVSEVIDTNSSSKISTLKTTNQDKKLLKVFFNGRAREGGAEVTVNTIMNEFIKNNWDIEYYSPTGRPSACFMDNGHKKVRFVNKEEFCKNKADVFAIWGNDFVWELDRSDIRNLFHNIQAKRKVYITNYRLGKLGSPESKHLWGFDEYIFYNEQHKAFFLNKRPKENTSIMLPPANLEKFFDIEVDYTNLNFCRFSSQGDKKFPSDFNENLEMLFKWFPCSEYHMMPAPTFLSEKWMVDHRVYCYPANSISVQEILKKANVFLLPLNRKFIDAGGKTVLEAQAAGLPVVTSDVGGALSMIQHGKNGYLCNHFKEFLDHIEKNLNTKEQREIMGNRTKEIAKETFKQNNANAWFKKLAGRLINNTNS